MTNQLESRHEFLSRGLGLAGNLGGLVCLNLVVWKKQKQKPNMEIETYSCYWNKQPLPRCTLIASVKMVGTGNRKQETSLYFLFKPQFSSAQFSRSVVSDFATPWITECQASLSITNSQSSLRLTSIESVIPSSHLILCRPLLLLPPIPPSFRVFSNESALRIRWPKYWSFSFSIRPSKEIPGLISFRMDLLDLLAVQGTQESYPTPQFKSISF